MSPVDKAGGDYWKISTPKGKIHVWRPKGYAGTSAVFYVHGYYVNSSQAVENYRLLDQFRVSGVQAIFIVPEAPSGADAPVYFPDLPGLIATVQSETGLTISPPFSAIGHSGAYRTLSKWLATAGLVTITLLDALYANVSDFSKWGARPGNKLVTVGATKSPSENSKSLIGKPGVQVVLLKNVQHMDLVTSGKYIPEFLKSAVSGGFSVILLAFAALAAAMWFLR
jgi:hypothetical protein